MTIKQFFKKVESANEINKAANNYQVRVVFKDGEDEETFTTWKEYAKYIKDTYQTWVADPLLNLESDGSIFTTSFYYQTDKTYCTNKAMYIIFLEGGL
jgi:hypothetical protein